MDRKVTIEAIAGELGVSKSAVSKALNGKTDISRELRAQFCTRQRSCTTARRRFITFWF